MSKRLQTIENMIVPGYYDQIWDCCCDHGLLGINLLKKQVAQQIHFIDIVPSIMAKLEQTLQKFFDLNQFKWTVNCDDVANIVISSDLKQKHLMIIAGVGGDQTIAMVNAIRTKHPQHQIDFLLCPVRHQYKLRSELIDLEYGLIDEQLILENKRFYELIHVSQQARSKLSPVGSVIWQQPNELSGAYLTQTINHYQRLSQHHSEQNITTLTAYLNVPVQ